jgi:hypothetical protein
MPASLLRCFAFAVLLCAAASCVAQTITIRVIDAAKRRPLPKQQVIVSLYYGGDQRAKYESEQTLMTGANGEVLYALPQPAPQHIAVQIVPDHGRWDCVCMTDFAPQTVLEAGIVESAAKKKHHRAAIIAKPGEVVFALRKVSFWRRCFSALKA